MDLSHFFRSVRASVPVYKLQLTWELVLIECCNVRGPSIYVAFCLPGTMLDIFDF